MFIFVVVVGVLVLFGVLALTSWYFSADQKARRAMRAVPRLSIREVQEGQRARVVGRVEVGQVLTAPLSGRACACWRVVVRERQGSGKSKHWVTIIDEHEATDFHVLGAGGERALVKGEFLLPVLDKDGRFSSGTFNDASADLEAFLTERGHSSQGWVFNKQMEYQEGVIEAGEHVCVVGVGRWRRDPDREATAGDGYREARVPQHLVLEAPEDGPLLVSDQSDMTS